MSEMTSNSTMPPVDFEEMLKHAEGALQAPVAIGMLFGQQVVVNPNGTLSIGSFVAPIDHKYLHGTELQKAAQRIVERRKTP